MFETEIIQIPILPLGTVNAHLIRSPAGCVLFDTSILGSERKIARVLNRLGLSVRDIRLIVISHAHTDHAGSAARMRDLSGAPILRMSVMSSITEATSRCTSVRPAASERCSSGHRCRTSPTRPSSRTSSWMRARR